MKVEELAKRDLKRNPILVIDKSLDRFKNYPIPEDKIISANEAAKSEDFIKLKESLKKNP